MFVPDGTLEAFGLVLARTSALVLSTPVLGLGVPFSGYKIGLIFSVAVLLYLVYPTQLPQVHTIEYGALALRELLIGFFFGFLLQLTTLTVRVAGQLIGHEMGFMMARQVDPATGVQTPLIASVYETFFLLAIVSMNGHHWLLRALGDSFDRAPVGDLDLSAGIVEGVQAMFSQMFEAGIVFAGPVLVFLLLTSILMGLLARVVPNLNILEIGFSVRVLVALLGMFMFAPLLEPAITGLHESLLGWIDHGLRALEG